jgi:4,5-DOPA dioxygenase extradiol
MIDKAKTHDINALLGYRAQAPHAIKAHPEDDHLMPFYVALGAADENYDARVLNDSYEFGNLAMTALRFYDQGDIATAA